MRACIIFAPLALFNSAFGLQPSFAEIMIDGSIGDLEWKDAQEFAFSSEDPKFDVTAWVRWDEIYLYFAWNHNLR